MTTAPNPSDPSAGRTPLTPAPASVAKLPVQKPKWFSATTVLPLLLIVVGFGAAYFFMREAHEATQQATTARAKTESMRQDLQRERQVNEALLTALTKLPETGESISIDSLFSKIEAVAANMEDQVGQATIFRRLAQACNQQGNFRDAARLTRRVLDGPTEHYDHNELLRLRSELAFNQLLAGDIPQGTTLCVELLDEADKSLDPKDPLRLAILNASANADFMRGDVDMGMRKAKEVIDGREDTLEKEDPNLPFALNTRVMTYIADENISAAIPVAERLIKLWEKYNPRHIAALSAKNTLASLYGRKTGSESQSVETLAGLVAEMQSERGARDAQTLQLTGEYINALIMAKDFEEAVTVGEESVALCEEALGADNSVTLVNKNGLGIAYHFAGRSADAVPLIKQVLVGTRARVGDEHDKTLELLTNLAKIQMTAGQIGDAITTAEESLELHRKNKGPEHTRTQSVIHALADMCAMSQRYDRAAELYLDNYKWRRNSLGASDVDTLVCGTNLINNYRAIGQAAEAVEIGNEVYSTAKEALGPDTPTTLIAGTSLARAMNDAGNTAEAVALAKETVDLANAKLGPNHGITCDARSSYYEALLGQEDYATAEQVARALFDAVKDADFSSTLRLSLAANMIGEAQIRQGNAAGAQQLLLAISAALNAEFPDHTLTAATNILLGEAYLEQGAYGKAEESLNKGYESLNAHLAKLAADDKKRLAQAKELLAKLNSVPRQ